MKNSEFLCPVAGKCGGCKGVSKDYEKELTEKEKFVKEQLKGLGKVEKIARMEDPYYYRCKVNSSFVYIKGKGMVCGPYEESTHRIVAVDRCLIEDRTAGGILDTLRQLIFSFKIRAYDEKSGYGLLRHVLIRVGKNTGEVMVVLVLNSPILPSKNNFVKALVKKHPQIKSIVINVNDRFTSMVLGPKNINIYGNGYITDKLCGLSFRISPSSFYQVNPVQAEKIYKKAIELAALSGKEEVIDAYCGTGTIGLFAAGFAGHVLGLELNKGAVKDAKANAVQNNVKNIDFVCADATEYMTGMSENGAKADVVILDPPRTGSTPEFIKAAAKLAPNRIVYVSCAPDTLARDIKVFEKCGYRMQSAYPYDMFPFTSHVETVCLLSKKP